MNIKAIRPTGSQEVVAMRISGEVYFLKDLPLSSGGRWVISKKRLVAAAVISGLLSKKDVLERYPDLTLEELRQWIAVVLKGKAEGLRATKPDRTVAENPALMDLSEAFSITVGNITLSSAKGVVVCGTGTGKAALTLTKLELRVLGYLMLNAGLVVQRPWLMERLYEDHSRRPSIKIFDVIVCKLRKRIKDVLGRDLIKTKWGRGYLIPIA